MNDAITAEDLRWFGVIAEAGGLTEAARAHGVSKSTLSRAVARAEAAAGAPLFDRTGRGLALTPLGERLLEPARQAMAALRASEEVLRVGAEAPSGPLRIGAVTVEAQRLLAPVVSELARRHPAVRTELRYGSQALDPVAEGLDVCIRIGRPEQPHLVVRRVFEAHLGLFASHDAALGVDLADPEEVAGIERVCVTLPSIPMDWTLRRGEETITLDRPPVFQVNDPATAMEVVLAGTGMACLPAFNAEDGLRTGKLVPALPGWTGGTLEVFAVMPPGRAKVPAVRAFLDLMGERAREIRHGMARSALRVVG